MQKEYYKPLIFNVDQLYVNQCIETSLLQSRNPAQYFESCWTYNIAPKGNNLFKFSFFNIYLVLKYLFGLFWLVYSNPSGRSGLARTDPDLWTAPSATFARLCTQCNITLPPATDMGLYGTEHCVVMQAPPLLGSWIVTPCPFAPYSYSMVDICCLHFLNGAYLSHTIKKQCYLIYTYNIILIIFFS